MEDFPKLKEGEFEHNTFSYYGYSKTLEVLKGKVFDLIHEKDSKLAGSLALWLAYLGSTWDHFTALEEAENRRQETRMDCCGRRYPIYNDGRIICNSCWVAHTRYHTKAVHAWEEFLNNQ